MPIETRSITTREEWLEWRRSDVTASAAASLLGAHERCTPLQLYLEKAGGLTAEPDSPAMRRGRLLEPLAADLIKEAHPNWEVLPARDYVRDTVHRLGCTPDIYVRDTFKKLGIVEIKSIEPGIFKRAWLSEDGTIEPPLAALVQAELTRHLTGASFAYIAALRVGHAVDFDLIEVPETPGLIERLQEAALAFWKAVERGEPPEPDFARDADLILRLHRTASTDKTVDLSGNNRLPFLAEEDAGLAEAEGAIKNQRRAIKAELVHLMGDAEVALANGRVVATAKLIKKKAYTVKPSEYRDVRFKRSAA